jgi:hypothetical protein
MVREIAGGLEKLGMDTRRFAKAALISLSFAT